MINSHRKLDSNKRSSPMMEYRHNILRTAIQSTKPCSTIDHTEEKSMIALNKHLGSLPSLHTFRKPKGRLHRSKATQSTRNLRNVNASALTILPQGLPVVEAYHPRARQINLSIPLSGFEGQSFTSRNNSRILKSVRGGCAMETNAFLWFDL